MSDTPRTDAAVALTSQHRYDDSFGDPIFGWVTANFARQLEREIARLRADQLRIDWLELSPDKRLNAVHDLWCNNGDISNVRQAIDAARKEQP